MDEELNIESNAPKISILNTKSRPH